MVGIIRYERRLPTPAEHRALAEAVGWGHALDWERILDSLARSVTGIVAMDGETAVVMARVVGDGVMYCSPQDIAVDPCYQRCGVGTALVAGLLDQLASRAPLFVGLFATPDGAGVYERAGFAVRNMIGMFQVLDDIPGSDERS